MKSAPRSIALRACVEVSAAALIIGRKHFKRKTGFLMGENIPVRVDTFSMWMKAEQLGLAPQTGFQYG